MSLLKYIAILGRQPELGMVELESLVGAGGVVAFGRQAALVRAELAVDRLGGTVKFGQVLYRGRTTGIRDLPVMVDELPVGSSKTPFALSVYGMKVMQREVLAAGLELKKRLKVRGSIRLVTPAKGTALTAAELWHNRVLQDGFELLVVVNGSEMIIARTHGVQNIDWYSKRDYERPARSARVGMLPPKLAQILINTTVAGTSVVDPFCGTGVVLQEALLLGREVMGCDLAGEMVQTSRSNLEWLAAVAPAPLPAWRLMEPADARQVRLPAGAAVVSEGYLGPNMTQPPAARDLARIKEELLGLYRESLRNFAGQLPSDGEVSITVPAWRVGREWSYLGLVDELADLGYTLKGFKAVPTPLLYAREDQVVGRQLLLLRKK